jgi:exopolyphosphatase/guanosine-5'-triphosphate,3'-diphosphate pyrophosphatase
VRRPTLIAVGGTPTSLAAAMQGPEAEAQNVDEFVMDVTQVSSWSEKLAEFSIAQRSKYRGIGPRRADIIVAGARILEKTMRFLDSDQVKVSTKGLRYGLAKKLLQTED